MTTNMFNKTKPGKDTDTKCEAYDIVEAAIVIVNVTISLESGDINVHSRAIACPKSVVHNATITVGSPIQRHFERPCFSADVVQAKVDGATRDIALAIKQQGNMKKIQLECDELKTSVKRLKDRLEAATVEAAAARKEMAKVNKQCQRSKNDNVRTAQQVEAAVDDLMAAERLVTKANADALVSEMKILIETIRCCRVDKELLLSELETTKKALADSQAEVETRRDNEHDLKTKFDKECMVFKDLQDNLNAQINICGKRDVEHQAIINGHDATTIELMDELQKITAARDALITELHQTRSKLTISNDTLLCETTRAREFIATIEADKKSLVACKRSAEDAYQRLVESSSNGPQNGEMALLRSENATLRASLDHFTRFFQQPGAMPMQMQMEPVYYHQGYQCYVPVNNMPFYPMASSAQPVYPMQSPVFS